MPDGSDSFPWLTHEGLTDVRGEPVLVRVDFNVPLSEDGSISDTRRMEASLPTVRDLLDAGVHPVLMSHFGRPGGNRSPDLSVERFVPVLEDLLGSPVRFATDCIGDEARGMVSELRSGEVGLLENLRFHAGETANEPSFVEELADPGAAYVNEAFGTSHRVHASIVGLPGQFEQAAAGTLMKREYTTLTRIRENPERPFLVLLGGVKVSDKFPLIRTLLPIADRILIGGAMAHTFFSALGYDVGESLVEVDGVSDATTLLEQCEDVRSTLVLAEDVRAEASDGRVESFSRDEIPPDWRAKDIGSKTVDRFATQLKEAAMVFWNGPMGVFEESEFETGTRELVNVLADCDSKVIVGGGETGAAVAKYESSDQFHHVSTGGGAALELLEEKSLPGFEVLDLAK